MPPRNTVRNTEIIVFAILTCISLLIYTHSIKNFFIADDLINLHFIRNFNENYLSFLFPHLKASDPIVNGRFYPFAIYELGILYKLFGAAAYPYHLISILMNSLNAFLIYCIAQRIGMDKPAAFISSLIFCCYRLNAQVILWITPIHYILGLTFLLLSFLLFLGAGENKKQRLAYAVLLYLIALFSSPQLILYPLIIGAYLLIFKNKSTATSLHKEQSKIFIGYVAIAGIFTLCNYISLLYFPTSKTTFLFSGSRFIGFLINLVAPYDLNHFIKIIVLLAGIYLIFIKKDRISAFLGLAILGNALFWAFLFPHSTSLLSPRYLYTASVFLALLLGYFLGPLITSVNLLKKSIAVFAIAVFVGLNAYLIVTQDAKWFEYLSSIGQKIHTIAQLSNAKKTVFIDGYCTLNDRNLEFFKDKITFISDKNKIDNNTYVVNTERNKYIAYFGRDFGKTYWYFPWFTTEQSLKNALLIPNGH